MMRALILVKFNLVCPSRTRELSVPMINTLSILVMRGLIRVDFHCAQSCAKSPSDVSLDTGKI